MNPHFKQLRLSLLLLVCGCLLGWSLPLAAAEQHWAYLPVKRRAVPSVNGATEPVDAFLLKRLHAAGLEFSPAADRRTLLRRLSFDLTGLPPTWEEVRHFTADESPEAVARAVERLLRSPHYGERMAQHWLDWVRYADTTGFHGDQPVKVWPYRDYVIDSFNRNQRFDQFTIEQLAGDLLPSPGTNQLIATAYNRLNRMTAEAGANDAEYRAVYAADRVRTTATVWLGTTLACAQCHDHKHDPFSLREFYEFAAFFADIEEQGYYPEGSGWGPELKLADPAVPRQREKLQQQIEDIDAASKSRRQVIQAEREKLAGQWRTALQHQKSFWRQLRPIKVETESGHTAIIRADDVIHLENSQGYSEVYSLWLPRIREDITALRLELLPVDGTARRQAAAKGSELLLTEVELLQVRQGTERAVEIGTVTASSQAGNHGQPRLAVDGQTGTGWQIDPRAHSEGRQAILTLGAPLRPEPDTWLLLRIRVNAGAQQQLLENLRVSFTSLHHVELTESGLPDELTKLLAAAPKSSSDTERAALATYLSRIDPEFQTLRRQRTVVLKQMSRLDEAEPAVLITRAMAPRPTRVLPRGNWLDDSGPLVAPEIPEVLGSLAGSPQATRLDLARWLVQREQPLTARVLMNRLWELHFGAGLVRTADDFGRFGEAPTHPELLDWLAAEFMESGWDWQHMVRVITSSRAYQQGTRPVAPALERDPENRLWSRQESFRLDAELIRDNALQVSGLLNPRTGGPSVRPYQPAGYYASLSFPVRDYEPSIGPDQYRRGLYTHWQRTFLHPVLKVFDAPSREECAVTRARSNTPLQALTLLNDPTFVEAARALAIRTMERAPGDDARLDIMFQSALQRLPEEAEKSELRKLIEAERAAARAAGRGFSNGFLQIGQSPLPERPERHELVVWTQAARVLLNLHETITRY